MIFFDIKYLEADALRLLGDVAIFALLLVLTTQLEQVPASFTFF